MSLEYFTDETFIYWTAERENIRKRRESGLPREQWTADPILRDFHYCNVSREHDRVTKWIKENIRDPFDAAGCLPELFQAVTIARFINSTETLGKLVEWGVLVSGYQINFDNLRAALLARQGRKEKVFGGAYLIPAAPKGNSKIEHVVGNIRNARPPQHRRTRQGFVAELCEQRGFADFMAGQVAADLAHTSYLRDASDHMTWAPRGPGAMRGMNRALGKPVDRKIHEHEYLAIGRAQMAMLPAGM